MGGVKLANSGLQTRQLVRVVRKSPKKPYFMILSQRNELLDLFVLRGYLCF